MSLSACQSATTVETPTPTNQRVERTQNQSQNLAQNNPDLSASSQQAGVAFEKIAPLAVTEARPPTLLNIPSLDLEVTVRPMGWMVVEKNGERTTEWSIPEGSAGWHLNSVGTGGDGNIILSGHQANGEAVFAPLALGEILMGQQVLLTAEDQQVYVYEVTEVSAPIPVIGATEQDQADALTYLQTNGEARLTMITGWPDFSTTHRLFAVAKFVGKAQNK